MTEINKYHSGKIYTIRSHKTDKYYIGSTCSPLYKRLYEHVKSKKYNDLDKHIRKRYMTSQEILKYDDYYIELLENFKCENKDELFKREGELIRLHKDNLVNNKINGRSKIEYYNDNKDDILERHKNYYEDNKDDILNRNKNYYEDNKDDILKRNKNYYKDNKIKISERQKKYKINNKDIINKKISCECGGSYNRSTKVRHLKTIKHTNFINQTITI
jgi:hypothetical protein